jgi:hypothetical protein
MNLLQHTQLLKGNILLGDRLSAALRIWGTLLPAYHPIIERGSRSLVAAAQQSRKPQCMHK